jgi:hypothetical protein
VGRGTIFIHRIPPRAFTSYQAQKENGISLGPSPRAPPLHPSKLPVTARSGLIKGGWKRKIKRGSKMGRAGRCVKRREKNKEGY